jgi:hypothetical protein
MIIAQIFVLTQLQAVRVRVSGVLSFFSSTAQAETSAARVFETNAVGHPGVARSARILHPATTHVDLPQRPYVVFIVARPLQHLQHQLVQSLIPRATSQCQCPRDTGPLFSPSPCALHLPLDFVSKCTVSSRLRAVFTSWHHVLKSLSPPRPSACCSMISAGPHTPICLFAGAPCLQPAVHY